MLFNRQQSPTPSRATTGWLPVSLLLSLSPSLFYLHLYSSRATVMLLSCSPSCHSTKLARLSFYLSLFYPTVKKCLIHLLSLLKCPTCFQTCTLDCCLHFRQSCPPSLIYLILHHGRDHNCLDSHAVKEAEQCGWRPPYTHTDSTLSRSFCP